MAAIELDGITKEFDTVTALNGVDLEVEEGEIFGFLGPNGAGKSTTINIMLDFVRPTEGTATVLGHDCREETRKIRKRIGVLPEGFDLYSRLTGRQHLEFVIDAKRAEADPDALIERVGLDPEAADQKTKGYSKGMKQRLSLAMALVGEPDLLILDEPSTGLDPNGARRMRNIVREEHERGATVFFSSHILGQVEAVCDSVGILHEGEFIARDSVQGLQEAADVGSLLTVQVGGTASQIDDGLAAVRELESVSEARQDSEGLKISVEDAAKMDVLSALEDAGLEVEDFDTDEPSLEDVFAAYTGGEDL